MTNPLDEAYRRRLREADHAVVTVQCPRCPSVRQNCSECDAALDEWIVRNGLPLDKFMPATPVEAVSEVES